MTVKNGKEVFVVLLSEVRQSTERAKEFFHEMGQSIQDKDIREALEARTFVSNGILNRIDECFRLIGERPAKLTGRLHDVFAEDFRREVAEIKNIEAKHLFVISRANQLTHLHLGELMTLIAAADLTGHFGVGVLLESCLADQVTFVERTRHLIRNMITTGVSEKLAA